VIRAACGDVFGLELYFCPLLTISSFIDSKLLMTITRVEAMVYA
jgi:hypothetical protein